MQGYTSKVQLINKIIEKLLQVSDENGCEQICGLLDQVYLTEDGKVDENFRHEYASISGKIRELNSTGVGTSTVDTLVYNIDYVYEYAKSKNKVYLKNLFKLKDHIGLEAGRITLVQQMQWEISHSRESVKSEMAYTQSLAESFSQEVRRTKGILDKLQKTARENEQQIEKTKKALEDLQKTSNDVVDKMESVQKDSITILGIFASIVFAFTAGMLFSSSVLENIDKASPYRLVGIVLLIGAVITNLIVLLLLYIDRIRMVKQVKIVYPRSIIIMNVFYIIGFIADFVVWLLIEKIGLI